MSELFSDRSIHYLPPCPPKNTTRQIYDIDYLLITLPNEIKMKIYKEYLEPYIYYLLYNEALLSITSKQLNIRLIRPYIPIIISKPLVLRYICEKCQIFRQVYIRHKIENDKNFVKINKGDSFALSILFYAYH